MGESSRHDSWELASKEALNLVLVGRTGNGKSATGNSILGREVFKLEISSSGVTGTCEMQGTVLKDGQQVNIIDTPGLYDFEVELDNIGKEIANCIYLAKDGIHAILVVFSVRNRFSREEAAVLHNLQIFFGEKIADYMIVVFTGGDGLKDMNRYFGPKCPEPLKEVPHLCKNRKVLFDNMTKDETKQVEQVLQLLYLVNDVIAENSGQPYSNELFVELKEGAMNLRNQKEDFDVVKENSKQEGLEQLLKRITEVVEMKLRDAMEGLKQQLAEEKAAWLKSEQNAQEAHEKSVDEYCKLRERLEHAQKEAENLKRQGDRKCVIL